MSKINVNNIDHDSVNIPIEMDRLQMIPTQGNKPRIRRGSVSPSRLPRDLASANDDDAIHFLNKTAPVAKSEFDDDDELDIDYPKTPQPGVDDAFLIGDTDDIDGYRPSNGMGPSRRPSVTPSYFPNSPGLGPDMSAPNTPVNVNLYQQRKTLAQGMMDLALLSANANQLRYVLESYNHHPYYYPSIVFISLSLFFQIAVGIGLIVNSTYDFTNKNEIYNANKVNNFTVIGIFIVTVVNVFISAFGVSAVPQYNQSSNLTNYI